MGERKSYESGRVHIDNYGFDENYGPTQLIQSFDLGQSLSKLSLSGVTLNETLTSSVYNFTAKVSNSVTSTNVTAQPVNFNAKTVMKLNGQVVTNPVPLSEGKNVITVDVNEPDTKKIGPNVAAFPMTYSTIKTYSVNVTREAASTWSNPPAPPAATPTPTVAPSSTPTATTTPTATPANPANGPVFNDKVNAEALKQKIASALASAPSHEFKDVPKTSWGAKSIEIASKIGIVGGYQDGKFHPENNVTRAEFATMLVNGLGLKSSAANTFTDAKGHWAENAINALKSNGIVNGYGDGSFKPNQVISRAEIVTMLAKLMDLSKVSTTSKFADVNGSWAQADINALASAGIVNGKKDNAFDPNGKASRMESTVMILRAFNVNLKLGLDL